MAATNKVTISIEAQSTKAIAAIEKLANSLQTLPATVNKINTSLTTLSKRMDTLNAKLGQTATKTMDASADLKSMNKDITSLSTRTNTAEKNITALGTSVSALNKVARGYQTASQAANTFASSTAKTSSVPTANVRNINPFASADAILRSGRGAIDSVTNTLSGGVGKVLTFTKAVSTQFLNLNESFRVAAQGITNIGRSLMFFVSIPLIGFLMKATNSAIDFEDSMIRVQKTTGISTKQTGELREKIRGLATVTASSHVELAKVAEVVGQAGIKGVDAIYNLTKVFEMMTQTMDMNSEEIATSMVGIANAFGWNLNESADNVFRLGNVINKLENDTNASASAIMTSMSKFAQSASLLNIPAAEAAGLSAAMVSMGLSEEEAGTALKRTSSQLIKNAERVAQLMGATEKYSTVQKVLNEINNDAVGVYLDIADAANKARDEGQNAEALYALINTADERGGRALAAMANNTDLVRSAIATANAEWERSTSLVEEYNRAMMSTKNTMAALKNNVNDAAITVGDALLPVLNKIAIILIPLIQEFSAWFKALGEGAGGAAKQLKVIGIVLAVLAAGPLLMLFGQLFHGVQLLAMSFGLFTKAIPGIIGGIQTLIPIIGGVAKAFLGWPALIAGAIVLVLKLLAGMGVNVAGFFRGIADAAITWGENLMTTYANGLAQGAAAVLKVISWIANLIAGFFESHSPPKEGPLSSIDKWGSALLKTYLKGFKQADFGVLSDVSKMIEKQLTRGLEGDALNQALAKYAKARVVLSSALSKYNDTGIIDTDLIDEALDGTGELKGDIAELIKLNIKYEAIQQRLLQIEEQRKGILRTYDAEIAAVGRSNDSIEDKVANIRGSMRVRDKSLRSLSVEEKALQAQSEEQKKQLDFQKAMVDAMMEQEDIIEKLLSAVEKLGRGVGSLASELEDFQFPSLDAGVDEETQATIDDATEAAKSFVERLDEGRQMLQGLKDGMAGVPPLSAEAFSNPEMYNYYTMLYNIGQKIADIKDKFDKVKTAVGEVTNKIKGVWSAIENVDWSSVFNFSKVKVKLPKLDFKNLPVIKDFIAGFIAGFDPGTFDRLKKAFESIKESFSRIVEYFKSPSGQGILKMIGTLFLGLARVVGFVAGFLVGAFGTLVGWFATLIAWAFKLFVSWRIFWLNLSTSISLAFVSIPIILSALWATIVTRFNSIITFLSTTWKNIKIAVASAWDAIALYIRTKFNEILAFFGITDAIKATWAQIWEDIKLIAVTLWERISSGIMAGLMIVYTFWVNIFSAIYNFWAGILSAIYNFWAGIFSAVWSVIVTYLSYVVSFWTATWNLIITIVKVIWAVVVNTIRQKLLEVVKIVGDYITKAANTAKEVGKQFVTIGKMIIQGLIDGISSMFGNVVNAVTNVVSGAVKIIKNLLGIKSPSKVFEMIGMYTIQGFVEGVDSEAARNAGFINSAISPVLSTNIPIIVPDQVTALGSGSYSLTLNFGKDSVRSDDDIRRIAAEVERVITKKARGKLGYNFGG